MALALNWQQKDHNLAFNNVDFNTVQTINLKTTTSHATFISTKNILVQGSTLQLQTEAPLANIMQSCSVKMTFADAADADVVVQQTGQDGQPLEKVLKLVLENVVQESANSSSRLYSYTSKGTVRLSLGMTATKLKIQLLDAAGNPVNLTQFGNNNFMIQLSEILI